MPTEYIYPAGWTQPTGWIPRPKSVSELLRQGAAEFPDFNRYPPFRSQSDQMAKFSAADGSEFDPMDDGRDADYMADRAADRYEMNLERGWDGFAR